MKIKIICIGKLKEKYLKDAISEYSKRLSRFCSFEITELSDEKIPDNASVAEEQKVLCTEGEKILKCISPTDYVISLCVEGIEMSSEDFAKKLSAGDIITLDGDLGAGKTAFTGGLAKGLGISGHVTSPTFTIVNEYRDGIMPLFHFDVYRLSSMDDLYDIGWDDYINQDGICVVEWADIVRDELSLPYYEIRITKIHDSEDKRKISIVYKGEK